MRRLLAILVCLVLLGASAVPALADDGQVIAPAAPRAVLDAKTANALRRLGPDGRAAAALAARGAPRDARTTGRANTLTSSPAVATEDDGGRLSAVAGAFAGAGGGMGLGFPLLLVGAFAAALGILAVRVITRRG